jgi:hypothetical protein
LKYSNLNLWFILFEFNRENKRKEIENSEQKKNQKSAQDTLSLDLFSPVGPAALSLSTRWGLPVDAIPLAHVRALCPISLCQPGPACRRCPLTRAPSPAGPWALHVNLVPPTVRVHDLRARCGLRAHDAREAAPAPPRPFLAACTPLPLPLPHSDLVQSSRTHPTPRALERTSLSSTAVVSCLFRGHRRALVVSIASVSFASMPTTWDTPRFTPSPSIPHCPQSLAFPPRSSSSTAVDTRPRRASTIVQGSRRLPSR